MLSYVWLGLSGNHDSVKFPIQSMPVKVEPVSITPVDSSEVTMAMALQAHKLEPFVPKHLTAMAGFSDLKFETAWEDIYRQTQYAISSFIIMYSYFLHNGIKLETKKLGSQSMRKIILKGMNAKFIKNCHVYVYLLLRCKKHFKGLVDALREKEITGPMSNGITYVKNIAINQTKAAITKKVKVQHPKIIELFEIIFAQYLKTLK